MGEVYHARDPRLDRSVAIKVLPQELASDQERLERFGREARLLAAVSHSSIATVHDFHNQSDNHFLVMELIGGESLADHILSGKASTADTVELFTQIALGLKSAHDHGVVHRDLKPDNIKIENSTIKILDFGLAKEGVPQPDISGAETPTILMSPSPGIVTEAGMVMGTPMYLSPEQARGKDLDERTDISAFGCCLYEALSGQLPFSGDTAADILSAVLTREPDLSKLPGTVPQTLKDLVCDCLQKDPEQRPRTMDQIIEHLGQVHNTAAAPVPKHQVTNPGLLVLIPFILIAIAAYTFMNLPQSAEPGNPTEEQTTAADAPNKEQLISDMFLALDAGELNDAFQLASQIEEIDANNTMLEPLWVRMSDIREIITTPPAPPYLTRALTMTSRNGRYSAAHRSKCALHLTPIA